MSAKSLTIHNDTSTLSNSNKYRLIEFIEITKIWKRTTRRRRKKINFRKLLLFTFNTSRQKDVQLYIDIYSFHLLSSTICYILKISLKPPFYVIFILITCIQIKKTLTMNLFVPWDFINTIVNFSSYSGLLFFRLITDTLQINMCMYRYLSLIVNITHYFVISI